MSRAELSACRLSFGPPFLDLLSQEVKEGLHEASGEDRKSCLSKRHLNIYDCRGPRKYCVYSVFR